MKRQFYTLDVFTHEALSGNPLAIVLDASGLDSTRMQNIAAEFNLSETVFVTETDEKFREAALRIFTPKNELPFAGHPTIGSAILLAMKGGLADGENCNLVLNEAVGPVKCSVIRSGDLMRAKFSLPKMPVRKPFEFDADLLAQALGISATDFDVSGHQAAVCDSGVPFPMVAINSLDAISSIVVDEAKLAQCFASLGFALELLVYCKEVRRCDSDYHVRMFAPAMGIAEDPATGSAAAAFAAQIMACDIPGEGTHDFMLEQGLEMGRPSRIELHMRVEGGRLVAASIGGAAVVVSEGHLFV